MRKLYSLIIILFITQIILPATKDEIYFKGSKADLAIDLSHPEKGITKLPVGSANIQNIAEAGDYIIGLTRPEYRKFSPIIFRFSKKDNRITDYTDYLSVGEAGMEPANGLPVSGSVVYSGSYASGKTGKLFMYDASAKKPGLVVLGTPKPGEGIYALSISADGKKIYGMLFPSNGFFVYDIDNKQFKLVAGAEVDTSGLELAKGIHEDSTSHLCRALGQDANGKVYGSTSRGEIFCFDPASWQIKIINSKLPYVQDRKATNRVESWALSPSGKLYGGTSVDGILFSLDPANGKVVNLGKPLTSGNLRSLIIRNGKLYGICGEYPEYTHFFTYDPAESSFEDLGIVRFHNPMLGAKHISYFMSNIMQLKDGRVLFTECDMMASLLFWIP